MQQEKQANGPKGAVASKDAREAQTITKGDVGTLHVGSTMPAPSTAKKKLSPDEIRALIRDYDKVEDQLKEEHKRILDLKRQRSKFVQAIYEGSPDTKSFRFKRSAGAEPEVLVIMSREDKNEKSPSFGERFFYFRRPGIPEPFDL
jgi:hypothetical protein